MLVKGREKGRPLNYLCDSVYEAKVLSAFQSAVLHCIRETRLFSKGCFGILRRSRPSQPVQPFGKA